MTYDNSHVWVVYNVLTAAQMQQISDNISWLHDDAAVIKAGLYVPILNASTIYKTSLDAKTTLLTQAIAANTLDANSKLHIKCLIGLKGSAGGGNTYVSAELGGSEIGKFNRGTAGSTWYYGWLDILLTNYDNQAIQYGEYQALNGDASAGAAISTTVNCANAQDLIFYGRVNGGGTGVAALMSCLVEYLA